MQTADCRLRIRRLQGAGGILAAIAFLSCASIACTVPAERSVLEEFFAAARLRDHTLLGNLATVTFEPLERGIVEDFKVDKVTPVDQNREEIDITAQLKRPDGAIVPTTLRVTLQHLILNDDPESARRWIVTAVR